MDETEYDQDNEETTPVETVETVPSVTPAPPVETATVPSVTSTPRLRLTVTQFTIAKRISTDQAAGYVAWAKTQWPNQKAPFSTWLTRYETYRARRVD